MTLAGNAFSDCWACSPALRMMTLPLAIFILVLTAVALLVYWIVRGPR